jgi:hypothetical protein
LSLFQIPAGFLAECLGIIRTVLVTEAATGLGMLMLLVLPLFGLLSDAAGVPVTLALLAAVVLVTLPLAQLLRPSMESPYRAT